MIKKKRERNIRVDELSAISWKTRAPVHLARNNDRLPIAANVLDKNAVSLGRRFSAAIDRDQWRFKMSAKGISISMELRGRERKRERSNASLALQRREEFRSLLAKGKKFTRLFNSIFDNL